MRVFRLTTPVMATALAGVAGVTPAVAAGRAPLVVHESATRITATGATLGGEITPAGSETRYEFELAFPACQGPVPPGCEGQETAVVGTGSVPAGAGPVEVNATAERLVPGIEYTFWVIATNSAGSTTGRARSFKTPPVAPSAMTGQATRITDSSAALSATVDAGGAPLTSCRFEYGASTAYGSSVACSRSPAPHSGPLPVTAALAGLNASTTYHFRITATNEAGASAGVDARFTTAAPPRQSGGAGAPAAGPAVAPGPGVLALSQPSPAATLLGLRAEPATSPLRAVLASTHLAVSATGAVRVPVACPSAGVVCEGRVSLRIPLGREKARSHRRRVYVVSGAFAVQPGRRGVVTLHLSHQARRAIAAAHSVRVLVSLITRVGNGPPATVIEHATLRASKVSRRA